jgi:hypothetical protein
VLTPLGKPTSCAPSKLDVPLFVALGRGSKSSRPKTVTIESLVSDSVRTGVEANPLDSRGVIVWLRKRPLHGHPRLFQFSIW